MGLGEGFALLRQWAPETQGRLDPLCAEVLGREAHVNAVDGVSGMAVLHFACRSGCRGVGNDEAAAQLVSQLIRKGADLNQRCTNTDMAPLHYAAYYGCPRVVAVLLKASTPKGKADANATTKEYRGRTALHLATMGGHAGAVKALLAGRAHARVKDGTGHIPLDLARTMLNDPNSSQVPKERMQEIVRLLESAGASPPVVKEPPSLMSPPALRRVKEWDDTSSMSSHVSSHLSAYGEDFDDLQVGDRVLVLKGNKGEGVVRFIGDTKFKPGRWYGVQLDHARGINNGTVGLVTYFRTKTNHGVFLRRSRLQLLSGGSRRASRAGSPRVGSPRAGSAHNQSPLLGHPAPFTAPTMNPHTHRPDHGLALERSPSPSPRASPRMQRRGSPQTTSKLGSPRAERRLMVENPKPTYRSPMHPDSPLKNQGLDSSPFAPLSEPFGVKSRVVVRGMMAIVLYIGDCHIGDGLFLGVEVAEAGRGEHDGSLDGITYFDCEEGRGLMVRPADASWHGHNCKVLLEEEDYNLDSALLGDK